MHAILAGLLAAGDCSNLLDKTCMPSAAAISSLANLDAAACCAKCDANEKCAAFTVNHAQKMCYLHPQAASTASGDCTSGILRTAPPTPAPPAPQPAPAGAKNVLMIIVDDLRPELGFYNHSFMITPNIDKLASEGTVFQRAYCQQAICGPTRNSFLSGRRPQRTQAWNFINHFREVGPNWISFPQYFKMHNYTTLGTGKTYHPNLPPNFDQPYSWSQDRDYVFAKNGYPKCKDFPGSMSCPSPGDISSFSDTIDMKGTMDDMDYALTLDRPFFLAFGAHRPHLPWNIPQQFWDMYPETEEIMLPKHEEAPKDMPPIAFTYECDGMTQLTAFHKKVPIPYPNASTAPPDNVTRTLRKGYYAAVTYTDHVIGTLLAHLESKGPAVVNNTVVALIGDHGWQLGEHNIWGKHTNFELGTRVPLIVKSPAHMPSVSPELVESVDLYPTIASLAGLPPPPDVDGTDLSPLMDAAASASDRSAAAKTAVFSEYPRCPKNLATPWDDTSSCVHTPREKFTVMGYSVRTMQWRYTAWLHWDGDKLVGDFSQAPVGEELYAHAGDDGDFDLFENANVAAANPDVAKQLLATAKAHWHKDGKGSTKTTTRSIAQHTYADADTQGEPVDQPPLLDARLQFEEWWKYDEA